MGAPFPLLLGKKCLILILIFSYFGRKSSASASEEDATCPFQNSESGFDVEVDLVLSDSNNNKNLVCTEQQFNQLGQIIQSGIQESSKRIYEWDRSWIKTYTSASICKSPKAQDLSSRRLYYDPHVKESFHLRRHLERHGFFRYYGAMRCSLCYNENTDHVDFQGAYYRYEREILKYDPTTKSMKCHKYWPRSVDPRNLLVDGTEDWFDADSEGSNFEFQIRDINTLVEFYVLDFDLHEKTNELQVWNGQHVYVSVDGNMIDLGPFYSDRDEGTRVGNITVGNDVVEWNLKPVNSTGRGAQIHTVNIIVPRSIYVHSGFLNFGIFFGSSNDAMIGKIYPMFRHHIIVTSANECHAASRQQQGQQRSLMKQQENVPISGPASSPVFAPRRRHARPKRKGKRNSTKRRRRKSSKVFSGRIHFLKKHRNKNRNKGGKNKNKKKKIRPEKDDKKTVVDEISIAKDSSPFNETLDQYIIADPTPLENITLPELVREIPKTRAYSSYFRLLATSTLTTLLNDMIRTFPFDAGHCMHGVDLGVVVNIEPRPQWVQQLPEDDQICGTGNIL